MKVLYIHQYFRKPSQGGPLRSYFLAKTLVDNGYEVEMITSHNGRQYVYKNIDGIKVHFLPVYYDNSLVFFSRIITFFKFVYKAYIFSKQIQNITCSYVTSTPLTVGIIGMLLKKYRGIPYYFEVRDLWPEAPIQMGIIKNPVIKLLLFKLEKHIYANADKIIALSQGIKNNILKVVPQKTVIMIPNIADCNFFNKEPIDKELTEKYIRKFSKVEQLKARRGDLVFNDTAFKNIVSRKFIITYFGAVGRINHLTYMLNVVKICKEKDIDVFFFIAGRGAEMQKIKKTAQNLALNNLAFLDFLNRDKLKELLNISDAAFISFAKIPVIQSSSPNKFFDGIASGKLCIVNFPGWIKELIESNRCGFYCDPEKPEEFITKITPFLKNKDLVLEYRNNARKLAETMFSKDILTKKFLRIFIPDANII